MLRLETPRLLLLDVEDSDLDGLLAVAVSNPAFTTSHEGSNGVPGHFDRGMLERELQLASQDPHRHALAVRRRDDGEVVGWAEVLDEHPTDGLPWIGLLELRADSQRQGYGREAALALLGWARAREAPALLLGVDDGNDRAAAFWQSLGFAAVDRRLRPSPNGPMPVTVMRCDLHGDDRGRKDVQP